MLRINGLYGLQNMLEYERSILYNKLFALIVKYMTINSSLDNISIVLVDTKTPANIGSVARAMMNMGCSRLVLVARRGQAR
jgi:hypothetical protein